MINPLPWKLDENDPSVIRSADDEIVAQDYTFKNVDDFEAICRLVNQDSMPGLSIAKLKNIKCGPELINCLSLLFPLYRFHYRRYANGQEVSVSGKKYSQMFSIDHNNRNDNYDLTPIKILTLILEIEGKIAEL